MKILEKSYQKLEKDEKEFNMNLMNGLICHSRESGNLNNRDRFPIKLGMTEEVQCI